SSAALATARDKAATRRLLQRLGLATVPFRRVRDARGAARATAAIGAPVVIKPQTGYDSLLAEIVHSPKAAAATVRQMHRTIARLPRPLQAQLSRGIMVEKALAGPLLSAELGIDHGRYWRFMLTEHRRARSAP